MTKRSNDTELLSAQNLAPSKVAASSYVRRRARSWKLKTALVLGSGASLSVFAAVDPAAANPESNVSDERSITASVVPPGTGGHESASRQELRGVTPLETGFRTAPGPGFELPNLRDTGPSLFPTFDAVDRVSDSGGPETNAADTLETANSDDSPATTSTPWSERTGLTMWEGEMEVSKWGDGRHRIVDTVRKSSLSWFDGNQPDLDVRTYSRGADGSYSRLRETGNLSIWNKFPLLPMDELLSSGDIWSETERTAAYQVVEPEDVVELGRVTSGGDGQDSAVDAFVSRASPDEVSSTRVRKRELPDGGVEAVIRTTTLDGRTNEFRSTITQINGPDRRVVEVTSDGNNYAQIVTVNGDDPDGTFGEGMSGRRVLELDSFGELDPLKTIIFPLGDRLRLDQNQGGPNQPDQHVSTTIDASSTGPRLHISNHDFVGGLASVVVTADRDKVQIEDNLVAAQDSVQINFNNGRSRIASTRSVPGDREGGGSFVSSKMALRAQRLDEMVSRGNAALTLESRGQVPPERNYLIAFE